MFKLFRTRTRPRTTPAPASPGCRFIDVEALQREGELESPVRELPRVEHSHSAGTPCHPRCRRWGMADVRVPTIPHQDAHTMGIEQLRWATARATPHHAGEVAVVERFNGHVVKVVFTEANVRGWPHLVQDAGSVPAAMAKAGQAIARTYGATWVGDTRS